MFSHLIQESYVRTIYIKMLREISVSPVYFGGSLILPTWDQLLQLTIWVIHSNCLAIALWLIYRRSPMLWSMRLLQRRNCRRWFMTTMHQVLRTSGLFRKTAMHSLGFCKLFFIVAKSSFVEFCFWFNSVLWITHVLSFLQLILISEINFFLFLKIRFRPRILRDVSKIDMTTTVLGFNISMPIMIAPTAFQKMAHPEGRCLCFWKVLLLKWDWFNAYFGVRAWDNPS